MYNLYNFQLQYFNIISSDGWCLKVSLHKFVIIWVNFQFKIRMSLYKNIGCINFHSETKWAEIFITDRHWLIQSKYLMSASESSKWLTSTCENYNRCVKKNLLQVYSEAGKFPSLVMNRGEVTELDMESNNSIQFLCEICGILVASLEAANASQSIVDIETGMFFR